MGKLVPRKEIRGGVSMVSMGLVMNAFSDMPVIRWGAFAVLVFGCFKLYFYP